MTRSTLIIADYTLRPNARSRGAQWPSYATCRPDRGPCWGGLHGYAA